MKSQPKKSFKCIRKNVTPITLANQFLYHEFLKIFRDQTSDPAFRQKLKRSVQNFKKRDGDHNYWLLVAAIAEGWRVKWVYRLLTNPGYVWNLEVRNISDLTMTGFNPRVVDRRIELSNRNFYTFAAYLTAHPQFHKKYLRNLQPQPERDHHPVFVFWEPKTRMLRLFDGMRRTTLAAMNNKKTIHAYVGYQTRKGKPMVNLDKIQYFKLLARDAKKDRMTNEAFVRVGREIVRQSRNGAKTFQNSIKPWSDAYEIQLLKKILK